jgi:replicative DNA helicase
MNTLFEPVILRSLLYQPEYSRKTLSFFKAEYFQQKSDRTLFTIIQELTQAFGTPPATEAVGIRLADTKGLSEDDYHTACQHLADFGDNSQEHIDLKWLLSETDKFLRDRALNGAVMGTLEILSSESKQDHSIIPDMFTKALSVRLDPPRAGLMFSVDDADYVWDKFNSPQQRFRTGVPSVDELTGGGLARTQVGVLTAGSGVGKSMALCAFAAEAARSGASVLYLNLESEDYELQTRIACNLAGIPSHRYRSLDRDALRAIHQGLSRYTVAVRDLLESSRPSDIRNAVEDFKLTTGRYPDVLCIDYLNEIEPEKDSNGRENSFSVMGKNLKEMLKLAKRINAALWTAVQLNREGLKKSRSVADPPDASHISESIAVLFKASLVLSLQLLPQGYEPEDNVGYLRLHTLKYRFNASRPECVIRLDYPLARFRELDLDEASRIITVAAVEEFNGRRSDRERKAQAGRPMPPGVASPPFTADGHVKIKPQRMPKKPGKALKGIEVTL